MNSSQALGMLLFAIGIAIFFYTAQVWSKARKDPDWISRGELRDLFAPAAVPLINAALVVLGALAGGAAFVTAFLLLRR